MDLVDNKPWRQLTWTMNIQYQYALPTAPTLPSLRRNNQDLIDNTMKYVYELLEFYMDQRGMEGRNCVLQAICENAQVDRHYGVYAKIISRVLTYV